MKLQLKLIAIATLALLNCSCKKNKIAAIQTPDNVVYQVPTTCPIAEMFWLADNETILVNDFCNGTLKKINTTAKSVGLIDLAARGHFIEDGMFYSEQLPQLFFYIARTQDAPGVYSLYFKLFSFNLTTSNSVLIKDSITQDPYVGGYTLGNKKLAIKSGSQLLVINLEQSTSQMLPISGNVLAFSPDDTKMLIFSSGTALTSVYDFTCQCSQPITLASYYGNLYWRMQGIYGSNFLTQSSLQYLNLQSGTVLKSFSFTGRVRGPWVSQNGSLAILFAEGPTYYTDHKGVLIGYDFVTGLTKDIATAFYYDDTLGRDLTALSPNQNKIAYVQSDNGNNVTLRVSVVP